MCAATRGLMSTRRDAPAVRSQNRGPRGHLGLPSCAGPQGIEARDFTRGLLLGKRDQFGEGDRNCTYLAPGAH
jgi:hypothetical protein